MKDAWKSYSESKICEAHQRFVESPCYVEQCATAAKHGYRPATLAERLYADPTRLFMWKENDGLWCLEE